MMQRRRSQKKKKKNKDKTEATEAPPAEVVPEEIKKVKKKKKKTSENGDGEVEEEEDSFDVDSGVFKKKFYTPDDLTQAMTKAEMKSYQAKEHITLYGKGRKTMKPVLQFKSLGFPSNIMAVCKGFEKPTPIQAQCWPVLASGRGVIGIAETGSGKTLAFTIPALAHLQHRTATEGRAAKGSPRMLIIAPTRELAMQSQEVLEAAGKECGIASVCVYGGVSKWGQKQALSQGVEVVVATPGRLIDLMQEGIISLAQVSYLVLDEADRMLDQGFERDIRQIVGETHKGRQTALFSATWPDSVRELAHSFLNRPIKVTIGSEDLAAGTRITQIVEVVEDRAREALLPKLLNKYHSSRKNRVLIFVLYKKEAARVEMTLKRTGWKVCSIHGDKSQEQRTQAVEQFKSGRFAAFMETRVRSRELKQ